MTDGIYKESRMLGDVKFHQHKGIDQKIADKWKDAYIEDFLGDLTWKVAQDLGYKGPELSFPTKVIKAIPRDQDLPLSFAQQRLWFFDQLQPGQATYNLSGAFRIKGISCFAIF